MKIPNIVLNRICTLKNALGASPSGIDYDTQLTGIKCYVEDKVKWENDSLNQGHQHSNYTLIAFNARSDMPFIIENDSIVTIDGDSREYIVVDAKKYKQISDIHWELVCK